MATRTQPDRKHSPSSRSTGRMLRLPESSSISNVDIGAQKLTIQSYSPCECVLCSALYCSWDTRRISLESVICFCNIDGFSSAKATRKRMIKGRHDPLSRQTSILVVLALIAATRQFCSTQSSILVRSAPVFLDCEVPRENSPKIGAVFLGELEKLLIVIAAGRSIRRAFCDEATSARNLGACVGTSS